MKEIVCAKEPEEAALSVRQSHHVAVLFLAVRVLGSL